MAWWQKLAGRTKKVESPQISFPVQFDLVPEKLSARVHLHDIDAQDGAVPCWTYVTNGLEAHGQKELIFSLRRGLKENPDDFPEAPLSFFTQLYHLAEQGRLVDAGEITEMATPSFLGHKGLLYAPPQSCQNIEGLGAALAAILLTEEELTAVKEFGPTRVMARLGQAYSYYPCPPWSERGRPSLSFARSIQQSILAKVPRLWMRGIRVRLENDRIVLRLLPQLSERIRDRLDQISLNTPLALLTNLDPSAHGCLVWEAGQSQPAAITPPGSAGRHLCGCFMLFVPEQSEDGGKLIEDGFGMMLTDASWTAIRRALATGENVSVPATVGGMSFQLEWIQTSYHNPIDGSVYHVEGGWNTYSPASSKEQDEESGPALMKRMVLLTHEQEINVRVGTKPLAVYMRDVEQAVGRHFASPAPSDGQDLLVQFELWPGGNVEVGFASRPEITHEVLEELHTSLLALPTPTVTHDSIKFQIEFALWGGSSSSE
jgi:hypothetical protein